MVAAQVAVAGEFQKCTYLNLGVKEAKDQVEAAKYLGGLPYVDKGRIGIWGWSFGGYMTIMSMSEGTPVFKAGVAVAAPTDWKYYDTVYTERFMRTPKENAEGYKATSAFSRADNLHGNLLPYCTVWQMIMFTSRTVQNMQSTWYNSENSSICRYTPTGIIASMVEIPVTTCIRS